MKQFLKRISLPFFAVVLLAGLLLQNAQPSRADDDAPLAIVIKIDGLISPSTLDLVTRSLQGAADQKADIVILEMQTPGGLYDSMQSIIQRILDSPVPVAAYVSPPGSHAASAGTYILEAAHIAAMAPSTVIGAATPIHMGDNSPMENFSADQVKEYATPKSTLDHKMVNDAAAYIRGLAELRGRNMEWAEKAVREAVSQTATEALASKSIDLIAVDDEELLNKIDGREVKMAGAKTMKLHTKGGRIETIHRDWRTDLLDIITNPNVAFLLIVFGAIGIIYECLHPGLFIPGVAGLIAFILGLFAMNVLPVNYTGLALLLTGIGLMVAEAFAPSFGALGLGGAISFAVGATMLIDSKDPTFGIDPYVIGGVTLTALVVLSILLAVALRAQKRPVVTGIEEMKAAVAEVVNWGSGKGEVRVAGELWSAIAASPDFIINPGDRVKILEIDGLRLIVQPE